MMEIKLLGRFSARRGGEEIPPGAFGGRLVRMLVRLLVTRRGEFVPQDVLAEALWRERLPADPVGNLRVLVNRARSALGDPTLVVTGPGGYSFAAGDQCAVDAEEFLASVEAGHAHYAAGQAGAALREFRAALSVWGGDPLPEDTYEDWVQPYRTRLERAHLDALEEAAAAALAVRDPVQAVDLAERAVAREPLRESAHVLLARALAGSGDSAAALRALHALRDLLADELGVEPSLEVRELEVRILRGEPLGPAIRRVGVTVAPSRFEELTFVGREAETETLLKILSGPDRGAALVSGIAGTGKTRLLKEVSSHSTLPVFVARAFLSGRDESWTLVRSLIGEVISLYPDSARSVPDRAAQALADVVPELEDFRPIPRAIIDGESRRALALEAAVRLLAVATAGGAVLVIDDLHWADATSVSLLGAVARRVPEAQLLLACRPEEVVPEGPVEALLRDLDGLGLVRVSLGPLPAEGVLRLFADEALAAALTEETDCTPMALAEVVRALAAQGAIAADVRGRWQSRTEDAGQLARKLAQAGQRRAINARAAWLSPSCRGTLRLLAVLGREAPARILAAAQGVEEMKVLEDLDALSRGDLVRLGDGGWATAHDLVAETITENLEGTDLRKLHLLLAQALKIEGGDRAEEARHLMGGGDRTAAADAFAEAAEQRLERCAGEEAARLADAGLELDPLRPVRLTLLKTRAEARALRGDLPGARNDLRAVLALIEHAPARARILAQVAMLTGGSSDYAEASDIIDVALMEAQADPAALAEVLAAAAILDLHNRRLESADAHSAEALALFEEFKDVQGIARALDARAMVTLMEGRFPDSTAMLGRVVRLYRDSGQLVKVGMPHSLQGWGLMMMGRPEEGLPKVEAALELERLLGQIEGEGWCLAVRSEVLTASARLREAAEDAHAALTLGRRLEHRELTAIALDALSRVDESGGRLDKAETDLREALDATSEMTYLRSWIEGRLASVLMARGALNTAEQHASRAMAVGIPLSQYEARLVLAEVALARGERDAGERAAEALAVAAGGGYLASSARERLTKLVKPVPKSTESKQPGGQHG